MYIPDPIEIAESSAERQYFEMLQGNGKVKCYCGELFNEDDGEFISPNPYAMPVCLNCAEKFFKLNNKNSWKKEIMEILIRISKN